MDNIAIETLAVNFVKDKLVLCNHLTPFISDNDKEPSWDGFIYIYNTNKKSKDDIFGRVPVQVKGKLVKKKDFAKKQITYSVKTADLRNYLNEGGTLFLVVYLSENGENKKIYYSELTPIRIRKILDVSPSAKSRSIIFKELPDDNNKIEQLAKLCFHNFKAQTSFANAPILTLQALTAKQKSINLCAYLPFDSQHDIPSLLFNDDASFYADFNGIDFPIDINPEGLCISREIAIPVKVNGLIFYSSYNYSKTISEEKITISRNITLVLDKANKSFTLNYNKSDILKEFITDSDFLIAVIESHSISLGDFVLEMNMTTLKAENNNKFDLSVAKQELAFYKNVDQVLSILCFKGNLSISKLSRDELNTINILIESLLKKKPVRINDKFVPKIKKISIQDHCFYLHLKCIDVKKKTYIIYDLFDLNLKATYSYNGNDDRPTSQYCLITQDDILNVDNIRIQDISTSFRPYMDDCENIKRLNTLLLSILLAYDTEKYWDQNALLLTAIDIANMILESEECEDVTYNTKKLNYLQTIKRHRKLDEKETNELYVIIENPENNDCEKWAAYVILENGESARRYFEKLDANTKESIKDVPIYNLYQKLILDNKTIN